MLITYPSVVMSEIFNLVSARHKKKKLYCKKKVGYATGKKETSAVLSNLLVET